MWYAQSSDGVRKVASQSLLHTSVKVRAKRDVHDILHSEKCIYTLMDKNIRPSLKMKKNILFTIFKSSKSDV